MVHITAVTADAPFLTTTTVIVLLLFLLRLCIIGGLVYLFVQLIRTLRKYLKSGESRKETAAVRKSLGEALKEHRVRCKMICGRTAGGPPGRTADTDIQLKCFIRQNGTF